MLPLINITGCVHLIHAGIQQRCDKKGVSGTQLLPRLFGDGQQGVNRQHRHTGTKRQTLYHRAGAAQAGEGAGASTKHQRVQVGPAQAALP
jgi:hypothetical protein